MHVGGRKPRYRRVLTVENELEGAKLQKEHMRVINSADHADAVPINRPSVQICISFAYPKAPFACSPLSCIIKADELWLKNIRAFIALHNSVVLRPSTLATVRRRVGFAGQMSRIRASSAVSHAGGPSLLCDKSHSFGSANVLIRAKKPRFLIPHRDRSKRAE